jgi:hypothetical protein
VLTLNLFCVSLGTLFARAARAWRKAATYSVLLGDGHGGGIEVDFWGAFGVL